MHLVSTFALLLSIAILWYGVATDSDILMLVGLFVLISASASF
ncbi:MAG: hypothetical protein ACO395_10570 [Pontimonas sp.]|jgi:hypothetical protein